MHILVTGGTGFLGQTLVNNLLDRGDAVTLLSRNFDKARQLFGQKVNLIGSVANSGLEVDAVINLAGEPIADKRWTNKRKRKLKESRIGITEEILQWLRKVERKPHTFISGSAIGYYGNHPESNKLDETAAPRNCFASELCREWEETARQAEELGIRVCTIRTGVVLGEGGGALSKMLLPFKMCLGGPIASGNQWFSWIHFEDWQDLILYVLDTDSIKGPVNATAPYAVTNDEFSYALGLALKRPAKMRMPAAVLGVLMGESSELLLDGQRVVPKKLLDNGFEFRYPELSKTLDSIIKD